jgi:hypothetical protein
MSEDILSRLGMKAEAAQESIITYFIGRIDRKPMFDGVGSTFAVPYTNREMLKNIITGDKVGAARELCEYIKKYVNSVEFMDAYTKLKEDAMPLRDDGEYGGSTLGTLKEEVAVFELNIKNYPNDAKYVAEQKQMKADNLKRIENLLETAKKPFPNKELWEKTYPDNPEVFVKKRLEEYLTLVATIDFDAKLTAPDKYNKMKFVNPVYEKKDMKWKAYYRAGKEVNEVFTAFVKEWLKGEIISSNKSKMTVVADSKAEINKKTSENTSTKNDNTAEPTKNNDSTTQAPKVKKTLLSKLKDKAKKVIQ